VPAVVQAGQRVDAGALLGLSAGALLDGEFIGGHSAGTPEAGYGQAE
jgi:hypothetical protein